MDSILDSIKKMLGISSDYTQFDEELIIFINSAINSLAQINSRISSSSKITTRSDNWDAIFGDAVDLEFAKEYIYLKVREIFDPPASSFALNALKECAEELAWRLSIQET